ncbi:NTTRR-F1 domain [Alkalihalobacillus oceani]|uniref:NTTRR-F1 domain n=2 Tax=Halalkalibacter oceani TaxID=1653776 RepID=A0A9X2DU47_9BACI|nr:NTTRR-F1 domain [Halalkalibacter oceani]
MEPWISLNGTIITDASHSGFQAVHLPGEVINSYVCHLIPAAPDESFGLSVALTKTSSSPAPPMTLAINYYDSAFNFIGYGLITHVEVDRIPVIENNTWMRVYHTSTPAPENTAQALVLVNTLPAEGAADIIVDDIALLTVEALGLAQPVHRVPQEPLGQWAQQE